MAEWRRGPWLVLTSSWSIVLVYPVAQGVRSHHEILGVLLPPELGAVMATLLPAHF